MLSISLHLAAGRRPKTVQEFKKTPSGDGRTEEQMRKTGSNDPIAAPLGKGRDLAWEQAGMAAWLALARARVEEARPLIHIRDGNAVQHT